MANPNKSSSPLDLTWHHHETTGKLTLVDRLDHANNHAYITRQEKEVEICGDVLTSALNQNKNASIDDFIAALNFYLNNDAFITFRL